MTSPAITVHDLCAVFAVSPLPRRPDSLSRLTAGQVAELEPVARRLLEADS